MLRSHALLRLATRPACLRHHVVERHTTFSRPRRNLMVLGIETSADDTCAALLEIKTKDAGQDIAVIRHSEQITCPNKHHQGIHPVEAVASHTRHLSRLVSKVTKSCMPELICVTRGPGMGGCLSVGVTTAKALSDIWNVPVVGVHHMQAHALTPMMQNALRRPERATAEPELPCSYPMLTLLVSGKHTMLLYTKSPVDHRVLASSETTALGECLDKIGRTLVPKWFIQYKQDAASYAAAMESFCLGDVSQDISNGTSNGSNVVYEAPTSRAEEVAVYQSDYTWKLGPLLAGTQEMIYDFTGFTGRILQILMEQPRMSDEERTVLGAHAMRLAFEHLISRVLIALETDEELMQNPPKSLVLSGGVASNHFLRQVARKTLRARDYGDIEVVVANPKWCTDNAPMIAFAGYKMYQDGWQTDKGFAVAAKWSIEEILTGVDSWERRPGFSPIPLAHSPAEQQESSADENEEETRFEDTYMNSSADTAAFEQSKEESVINLDELDQYLTTLETYVEQVDSGSQVQSFYDARYEEAEDEDAFDDEFEDSPTFSKAANPVKQAKPSAAAPSHSSSFKEWRKQRLPDEIANGDGAERTGLKGRLGPLVTPKRSDDIAEGESARPTGVTERFGRLEAPKGNDAIRKKLAGLRRADPSVHYICSDHGELYGAVVPVHRQQKQANMHSGTPSSNKPTRAATHPSEDYISMTRARHLYAARVREMNAKAAPLPRTQPGLAYKQHTVAPYASEVKDVKVRFVGSVKAPPAKEPMSFTGKVASVFGGWLGGK